MYKILIIFFMIVVMMCSAIAEPTTIVGDCHPPSKDIICKGYNPDGSPIYSQTDEAIANAKQKQIKRISDAKFRYKDFMPLVNSSNFYTNKIIDLCVLTKNITNARQICKVEIAKLAYLRYINENIAKQIQKYGNVCITYLLQYEKLDRHQSFNICSTMLNEFDSTMSLYIRDMNNKELDTLPICNGDMKTNCKIVKPTPTLPVCSDTNNFTNCNLK